MSSLETDLARIAALSERQRDDSRAFVYYVDILWDQEARPDAELDALVEAIAARVIPQIDCTICANCCRSMHVGLVPADLPALVRARPLPSGQFTARYVDFQAAASLDEWGIFRARPCPFLRSHLCTVYPARPQACRDYPALTPDFRWQMESLGEGAGQCPIIFNVFERLKRALGWK